MFELLDYNQLEALHLLFNTAITILLPKDILPSQFFRTIKERILTHGLYRLYIRGGYLWCKDRRLEGVNDALSFQSTFPLNVMLTTGKTVTIAIKQGVVYKHPVVDESRYHFGIPQHPVVAIVSGTSQLYYDGTFLISYCDYKLEGLSIRHADYDNDYCASILIVTTDAFIDFDRETCTTSILICNINISPRDIFHLSGQYLMLTDHRVYRWSIADHVLTLKLVPLPKQAVHLDGGCVTLEDGSIHVIESDRTEGGITISTRPFTS